MKSTNKVRHSLVCSQLESKRILEEADSRLKYLSSVLKETANLTKDKHLCTTGCTKEGTNHTSRSLQLWGHPEL